MAAEQGRGFGRQLQPPGAVGAGGGELGAVFGGNGDAGEGFAGIGDGAGNGVVLRLHMGDAEAEHQSAEGTAEATMVFFHSFV